MIRDYFVGGFCTAEDGVAMIGQSCKPKRAALTDQMEIPSDFEHFPYQKGEGVGLTLKRDLFVKANRDLSPAFMGLLERCSGRNVESQPRIDKTSPESVSSRAKLAHPAGAFSSR